jgi:hypothetical protein
MATQLQTIAQFGDGAAVVQLEYNDASNRVTAITATVTAGVLFIELTRQGGQTRTFTIGTGTTRSTNVPQGMDLGIDPDTGAASFSRGNISTRMRWAA